MADVVAEIWERSRRTYGWRRVQAELAEVYGHRASRKLVLSVMREQQISGLPRRRGRRPDLSWTQTASDLVNREFGRDRPNQLWMTDITEHPTREGKLYVRAVLDAWSRKVVGWPIDRRATAAMVNSALAMAIESRRPRPGAVVHSDHRLNPANTRRGRSASGSEKRTWSSRWEPWATRSGRVCRPSY